VIDIIIKKKKNKINYLGLDGYMGFSPLEFSGFSGFWLLQLCNGKFGGFDALVMANQGGKE